MCAMDGQANTVMFAAADVAAGAAAVILTVVVAATTGCVRFRFFDSLLIVQ